MTPDIQNAGQSSSHYLHGTAPGEQHRLSLMNEVLNQASLGELGLKGGERILDVGCGLAQLTRAMARVAGERVVGVERSAEQLREAERQAREAGEENLVDLRQGDALALPVGESEWGSFDIAHTRFLLEHVPDPLAVVRAMVRAVRPGGRIVLEDDSHDVLRLWPEPPGFAPLWNAYMRSFDRLGNDGLIGHRLVSLIYDAGAKPVRNTWLFFGSCAGNPKFDLFVNNLVGVIEGSRELVVSGGLLDRAGFDDAVAAIRTWNRRPDAAIWYAYAWAEGMKEAAMDNRP